MNTGFKNLDKVFNIEQAQLVLLTGRTFVDMLSGDIANNICLANDRFEVVEIVSCFKEYLIKRLFINQAEVNYRTWCLKDQYTEDELKQIGQATVNLIEVTKRLPRIVENDIFWGLKELKKYIYNFVNTHADRDEISSLLIIDISPFNSYPDKKDKKYYKYKRFTKAISKYAKRYNCPIMMICTNEKILEKIKKYADRIINVKDRADDGAFNVSIIENNNIIGSCKLNYNNEYRRFEDC